MLNVKLKVISCLTRMIPSTEVSIRRFRFLSFEIYVLTNKINQNKCTRQIDLFHVVIASVTPAAVPH